MEKLKDDTVRKSAWNYTYVKPRGRKDVAGSKRDGLTKELGPAESNRRPNPWK
jgi:hypothetical protein